MKAYHFLYEENKMRDGNIAPVDGEWLEVKGDIELWALRISMLNSAFGCTFKERISVLKGL